LFNVWYNFCYAFPLLKPPADHLTNHCTPPLVHGPQFEKHWSKSCPTYTYFPFTLWQYLKTLHICAIKFMHDTLMLTVHLDYQYLTASSHRFNILHVFSSSVLQQHKIYNNNKTYIYSNSDHGFPWTHGRVSVVQRWQPLLSYTFIQQRSYSLHKFMVKKYPRLQTICASYDTWF
jgi:hypothetical protein